MSGAWWRQAWGEGVVTTLGARNGGNLHAGSPLPRFIGSSPVIRQVETILRKAARCESTVLLCGETGTGKGLAAEVIHCNSARRGRAFVVVDGTVLRDELATSQLFGHLKGTFTGASEARRGIVGASDGGTLFVDEIGEASPYVQAALLRLLDEKRFQRLGEPHWTPVDCRVICATRRDLPAMVRAGQFREDLLWRIRCVEVRLPALRDRGNDVLLLARFFLDALSQHNETRCMLDESACVELRLHSWPGNVRELKQRLERAFVLAEGEVITAGLLGLPASGVHTPQPSPARSLDELERQSLVQALMRSGGNQRQAARLLGIAESSLRSKLHKHTIDCDRFRAGQEPVRLNRRPDDSR